MSNMEIKKNATAEDQLQINKFARLHKIFMENKTELAYLNNESRNIGDAEDEIIMLDEDNSASIPFQIGSIFVHYNQDETSEKLDFAKNNTLKRILEIQNCQVKLEEDLKQLRSILYSKFGDNIQLEMNSEE